MKDSNIQSKRNEEIAAQPSQQKEQEKLKKPVAQNSVLAEPSAQIGDHLGDNEGDNEDNDDYDGYYDEEDDGSRRSKRSKRSKLSKKSIIKAKKQESSPKNFITK